MTVHHLISEEQAVHRCLYCGKEIDIGAWKSCFHIRKHYKEHTCDCGKVQWVTVDINGSGHDNWIEQKIGELSLEDKVK